MGEPYQLTLSARGSGLDVNLALGAPRRPAATVLERKPLRRGEHVPEMSEAVARRVCRLSTTAMHTETHHDIDGLQLFDANQLAY